MVVVVEEGEVIAEAPSTQGGQADEATAYKSAWPETAVQPMELATEGAHELPIETPSKAGERGVRNGGTGAGVGLKHKSAETEAPVGSEEPQGMSGGGAVSGVERMEDNKRMWAGRLRKRKGLEPQAPALDTDTRAQRGPCDANRVEKTVGGKRKGRDAVQDKDADRASPGKRVRKR